MDRPYDPYDPLSQFSEEASELFYREWQVRQAAPSPNAEGQSLDGLADERAGSGHDDQGGLRLEKEKATPADSRHLQPPPLSTSSTPTPPLPTRPSKRPPSTLRDSHAPSSPEFVDEGGSENESASNISGQPLTKEEQKKERKRVINRASAKLQRSKKKGELEQLKIELAERDAEVARLRAAEDRLREDNASLEERLETA